MTVKPDNSEQRANELVEAKSEIVKLRARLRRTEEERDILKKRPRGTSLNSRSEVPAHQRSSRRVQDRHDVSCAARFAQRLLCVVA